MGIINTILSSISYNLLLRAFKRQYKKAVRNRFRAIDDNPDNFCYFSKPVLQMGLPFEEGATMLTPEGYFYNGSSELLFGIGKRDGKDIKFIDSDTEKFGVRVKNSIAGYLPGAEYNIRYGRGSVKITAFQYGCKFNGTKFKYPLNFIGITPPGEAAGSRAESEDVFYLGYKYGSPDSDHRCKIRLPEKAPYRKFSSAWTYKFETKILRFPDNDTMEAVEAIRDGYLVYLLLYPESENVKIKKYSTLGRKYEGPFGGIGNPNTPVQLIGLDIISDGSRKNNPNDTSPDFPPKFIVIYPQYPIKYELYNREVFPRLFDTDLRNNGGSAEFLCGKKNIFSEYLGKFSEFWDGNLAKAASIEVPEKKATFTHKSSLIYNLMCMTVPDSVEIADTQGDTESPEKGGLDFRKLPKKISQHVNRFQYNDFWLRDGAFFARMYMMFGLPEIAERQLMYFTEKQRKDGLFISQRGQYDGFGQVLWSIGEYIKYYGVDAEDFARKIEPYIDMALKWFIRKVFRKRKMMPTAWALDNEQIIGKYTGHNIWAYNGLLGAEFLYALLRAANPNNKEYTEKYRKVREMRIVFGDLLRRKIRKAASKNNMYVPPGLDISPRIGFEWGNLLLLYPNKIFDADDPIVKNTIERYRREKYAEGIATYSPYFLHHYITERVAQNCLIMGKQVNTIEDLYSMLAHTGTFNEGFEFCVPVYGNRDYYIKLGPVRFYNFPPHGWFAALYNTLLRNIFVREEIKIPAAVSETPVYKGDLILFSALSPSWIKEGTVISVKNIRTYFGPLNAELHTLSFNANKCILRYKIELKRNIRSPIKPENIIIPSPFFTERILSLKPEAGTEIGHNDRSIVIGGIRNKNEDSERTDEPVAKETKFEFTVHYKLSAECPDLSYRKTVEMLINEYNSEE